MGDLLISPLSTEALKKGLYTFWKEGKHQRLHSRSLGVLLGMQGYASWHHREGKVSQKVSFHLHRCTWTAASYPLRQTELSGKAAARRCKGPRLEETDVFQCLLNDYKLERTTWQEKGHDYPEVGTDRRISANCWHCLPKGIITSYCELCDFKQQKRIYQSSRNHQYETKRLARSWFSSSPKERSLPFHRLEEMLAVLSIAWLVCP